MEEVERVKQLLQFLDNWTKVLSTRVTMLLALVLTFVLYGWAFYQNNTTTLIGAAVFGVLVFLPTVWMDVRERVKKGE